MNLSVPLVFLLVFLSGIGVTLGIPSFPPAYILYTWIGAPAIPYDLAGFSGEILVKGAINGASWGLFIALIYGLGYSGSRRIYLMPEKPSPPTPVLPATPAAEPPREPAPPVTREPAMRRTTSDVPFTPKNFTYVPLRKAVETIEGIGPTYGSRLRFHDVKDVEELLRAGATGRGRRELAIQVGVSPKTFFSWVNKADFSRIRGVGSQYADLLDATGVKTVEDLGWRDPLTLYRQVKAVNGERTLVKRTPPYNLVENWIQSAKKLQQVVEC